jgi:hypothetical protein
MEKVRLREPIQLGQQTPGESGESPCNYKVDQLVAPDIYAYEFGSFQILSYRSYAEAERRIDYHSHYHEADQKKCEAQQIVICRVKESRPRDSVYHWKTIMYKSWLNARVNIAKYNPRRLTQNHPMTTAMIAATTGAAGKAK